MTYNDEGTTVIGSDVDLEKRTELYKTLNRWREDLPMDLRDEVNFVPQTCYLR